MKLKLLSFFLLSVFAPLLVMAYEVNTSVQKRNILLEEFTGIHCGNCPQGHAVARNLINSQQECAYSIAIHAGHYASPGPDEPDFRIEEGTLIKDEFEIDNYGYPSGTINRHAFASPSIVTGRASWIKNAKEIHSEDALVNLWMESEFNGDTREIEIKIEGYYTQEITAPFNLLTIAVTENNIKGPQNGGGIGSDYIHNHMLRDFVTPVWGDTIYNPTKGEYFSLEYTYLLPEHINGVEVNPEEIELITFISTNKTEVLNVIGGKPSFKNYDKPLKASIYAHHRPVSTRYGYNFFEIIMKNESDKEITNAEFTISINQKEKEVNWQGTIPAFHTQTIRVEADNNTFDQKNEYNITLTHINGEKITESTIKGDFTAPIGTSAKIFLEIQTDLYADENTFTIKNKNGDIIKEFGPYPSGRKEVYKEEIELEENEIYCFEVTDLWGDGIQQPKGYYKLYNENNDMFAQQYDIKEYGDRVFFQTTGVSSINNSTNTPSFPQVYFNKQDNNLYLDSQTALTQRSEVYIYDITGKLIFIKTTLPHSVSSLIYLENVSNWNKGIYLLTLVQNGKTETIKFALY